MTRPGSTSADTHQALLDAAFRVFADRGFARATTREIAAAAEVAEGTIYRHFADKHALFREVFFSVVGAMGGELRRLPERAGSGTVRGNLEYLLGLLGALQERTAPLLASMSADPELAGSVEAHVREHDLDGFDVAAPLAIVAAYVRAEQALGRMRTDVDASDAAAVIAAVPFARGVVRASSPHPPAHAAGGGFQTEAAGVIDILVQGLAPAS